MGYTSIDNIHILLCLHLTSAKTAVITTRGKNFLLNFISTRDGPEKVQKQGRDERMKEDYPTSTKIHNRYSVVFLRSIISALFLYIFSGPSLLEIKFCSNIFPQFLFFFREFLNHLPDKRQTHLLCCTSDEHVENVCSNFNHTQTHAHTHTHKQLPAIFKQYFSRDDCYSQVLTSENGWQLSHAYHTHFQVCYTHKLMYAIVFSAGLKGLQVDCQVS